MSELAVATLSRDEARSLTDEVKHDAERLWRKLVELYDGGAHIALEYTSWGAYFEAEFGESAGRGKQLLRAGRVLEAVEGTNVPSPANEAQARELAPLLDEPEALREAWAEANERSDRQPTAAIVREVVQEHDVLAARIVKPRRPRIAAAVRDVVASAVRHGGVYHVPAKAMTALIASVGKEG